MANLKIVLKQLQSERAVVETQINGLDSALSVLDGLGSRRPGRRGGRRNLSPAARRRIAMAQKKRWAAWKAKHKA